MVWALRRAGLLGVLVWSASTLAEFGYRLAAEQTLARAVRAAALEATLPRATRSSIEQVIRVRLDEWAIPHAEAQIALACDGRPVVGAFHPQPGDRISVMLSVPPQAVLPGWLRTVRPRARSQPITAHAVREFPTRTLTLPAVR